MRIAIDLDGICADLLAKWLRVYNLEYDDTLTKADITQWDVSNCVKPACGKRVFDIIKRPGFFDDLEVIPGAIAGVQAIRDMGCEIVFASAPAGPDSARAKYEWLARHFGVSDHDVFLCNRKTWLKADVLIDDRAETLVEWAKTRSTGMSLGIAYPYNQNAVGGRAMVFPGWANTEAAWERIVDAIRMDREWR